MQLNSFKELYLHQLQDMYDAEKRLSESWPKMAEKANNHDLKKTLQDHQQKTTRQIQRLEQCFEDLGVQPETRSCHAMKGLLLEGKELVEAEGDGDVIDAGIIASAQRIQHYEISGYGTARSYAGRLGLEKSAKLLKESLEEEAKADQRLTKLAETSGGINQKAQTARV